MKAHLRFLCLSLAMLCIGAVSRAQLTGAITVPSTTYPDLASVITALNTVGVGAGGATINLTASNPQTAPSGGYRLGSATLNASLSAANKLTINGGSNTVTGAAGTGSNDGIFWLLGVDYVTINALHLLDVSTTTTTTSTAGNEWGYVLGKRNTAAPYDGCQNDVINGCNISLNPWLAATSSVTPTAITSFPFAGTSTGILMAHITTASTSPSTTGYTAGDANSFNKFTANTITNVGRGFYLGAPISLGVALYDKRNEVGGTTAASGNTITVGGTTATSPKYGVITLLDSVVTVQNNKFYTSSAQTGNAAIYYYYAGAGVGDLNVKNNYFDVNTNNTSALVACYWNYAVSGATYGHTDGGTSRSTHTITGNEVTGNGNAVTTSSLYCFYDYYAYCQNMYLDNNNIHDITWGASAASTSTNNIFGLYTYYNQTGGIQSMSGNRFVRVTRNGPGSTYATYGQQGNSTGGTFFMERNVMQKIVATQTASSSTNYIYLFYNWTNSASGQRMYMRHNKMDSIDNSGVSLGTGYIQNYCYYYTDSSQYTYDTMTNWFAHPTSTTSFYWYNYIYQYYGQKGSRLSHWYIDNWKGNAVYAYNYLGYYMQYVDSNIVQNVNIGLAANTATGQLYNMFGYYGDNGFARGNKFYNLTTSGQAIYNFIGYYGTNYQIQNNSLRKFECSTSGAIYNYLSFGATGAKAYGNVVDSMAVGTGTMYAWYGYANGANDTMYNNRVSNLRVTTGTSNAIYGYYIYSSAATADWHFYNNVLSNIELPANFGGSNVFGIYTGGTCNYKLFNNTVRISPTTTNLGLGSYGATGIYYLNTGTLDLRNNIVYVNVPPTGTALTAALRRSTGTTNVKPVNFLSSSNSNIYYAPNLTNSYLYCENTNSTNVVNPYNLTIDPAFNNGSCGAYKTFQGHEHATMTENNLTVGPLPGTYVPSGASYAESGGTATSNPTVTTDYAGVARPTPSDIGALQFSGTILDNAAPQIAYTPVPTTSYCLSAPTIVATITDQTGVNNTLGSPFNTNPGTAPKLYYKLSTENNAFSTTNNTNTFNGWHWVEPTISGNQYTFVMDYSKVSSTVTAGSTMQYFIIAQDVTSSTYTSAITASFASCPSSSTIAATNTVNATPAPNQFTVLVAPSFTVKAAMPSICVSGSTTVSVTPIPVGATIQWESATPTGTFSPIAGATSPTYTTPVLTTSTRYRLVINCGPTVLQTTSPVTVNINNPGLVTPPAGATRCGWGPLTLSGTPTPGATLNWYASATSTTPIAQGNTFNTGNLGSSVTYYVSAVVPKGAVEDLGKAVPTLYSYFSGSFSGYGMNVHFSDTTDFYQTTVYAMNTGTSALEIELIDMNPMSANYGARQPGCVYTATITSSGFNLAGKHVANLNWTNIPPGDYRMVVGSSNTSWLHIEYKSPTWYPMYSSITGRSWLAGAFAGGAADYYYMFFYDNKISGPCENPTRTAVTATVNPSTPIVASSPNSPGVCTGQSATLNVTSTNPTYLYQWQPGSLSGATQTVTPATTTKYIVNAMDVLSGCTAIDSITIGVNPKQNPPAITPLNSTICQNSNVLLTATPSTPFGGTGTIGTGTSSPGAYGWPAPLQSYYPANHEQYIVRASELITAGVQAGAIKSIAFYLNSSYTGVGIQNLKIQLGHTTATTMTSAFISTGLQTVYSIPNGTYSPTATSGNWEVIPFSTPFQWDGVSNIVVDISMIKCNSCPTNCTQVYSLSFDARYSTAPFTSTAYTQYAYDCTTPTFSPSVSLTTSTLRPNMQFNWAKPYTINWLNVTGLYKNFPPLSGPMSLTDTNSKVYASPATTQTYTAVSNAQGCVSNASAAATVNVNPAPPTAITPAGAQTLCAGGSLVLNAPTGATMSYQWLLNNAIITGATSSTYTATAAGSYRVRVVNLSTNCFDTTAVPTVITLNPLPTATIAAGGATTFCNGGSVVLTLTTNASPASIQWNNNGVPMPGFNGTTYTATTSGTYTATVINSNQCTQTSNAIVVTSNATPTTITPSSSTTFCAGGSVTLNAPTTGVGSPYTYQWYLNNTIITGATNSSYTATAAGTYHVVVNSASTGCGGQSLPVVVTIGSAPSSAITPSAAQTICQGDSVILKTNNSAGLTYVWRLNGSPITGATDSIWKAKVPGTYTVTVAIASQPSCASTTTSGTVVNVNPAPVLTASAGGATTFCQGGNVIITASGTGAGQYELYNNGVSVSPAQTSPSFTVSTSGNFSITGINTTTGCKGTSNVISVTVNPAPALAVTSSGPTNFCQGGIDTLTATAGLANYQWYNNSSPIGGATTNKLVVNSTGVYTVSAMGSNGCYATSQAVVIQVNPAPIVTTTPTDTVHLCSGITTTICTSSNSIYGYSWERNTLPISGATLPCYTTGQTGSYKVTVTNTVTGCSTTSLPVVVNVLPPPTATASRQGLATICSNDSSELNAAVIAGMAYQWNRNGSPIAGATNAKYFAKQQGTYTVTATNQAGCSATSTPGITITVNPAPPAFITYNTPLTFCEGSAVVLTANTGTGISYTWFINDTAITNSTNSTIATTSGVYKIRTTNTFGCSTLSDTVNVTAYPKPTPTITRSGTTLGTTTTYASYQWFFNNNAIGGATAQTYTFTQNGAYKVRVISADGCEGWSELIFVQNVGITPSPITAAIKVYPNPTTGLLNIEAPVKLKLAVRDVTGKLVAEGTAVKQLDITEVANGTYLLYISDMDGKLLRADKVTKTTN